MEDAWNWITLSDAARGILADWRASEGAEDGRKGLRLSSVSAGHGAAVVLDGEEPPALPVMKPLDIETALRPRPKLELERPAGTENGLPAGRPHPPGGGETGGD